MAAKELKPKYGPGEVVEYVDRHGRLQTGKVRSIEGNWTGYGGNPYLVYCLQHPTYRNGNFYCGEDVIMTALK